MFFGKGESDNRGEFSEWSFAIWRLGEVFDAISVVQENDSLSFISYEIDQFSLWIGFWKSIWMSSSFIESGKKIFFRFCTLNPDITNGLLKPCQKKNFFPVE